MTESNPRPPPEKSRGAMIRTKPAIEPSVGDGRTVSRPVPLSEPEQRVVQILGCRRRLYLSSLSEAQRRTVIDAIGSLHNSDGLSILEIAKRMGKSQPFLWNLCKHLEIPMRPVATANRVSAAFRSKHAKTPFRGSENERLYLMGFAHGDLDVRRVSELAIMASSTSTHPSFVSLFEILFRMYGPVYRYPVFDKTRGYSWKVAARFDNSFAFMLPHERRDFPDSRNPSLFFAWLAGIVDSDGSIGIIHAGKYVRMNLEISNQDLVLLEHIKRELLRLGYFPTGPYKRHSKGFETAGWNIRYNQDMCYLAIQRAGEVREILNLLPLKHEEKCKRKKFVLRLRVPGVWDTEGPGIEILRRDTARTVEEYVRVAKESYENRRMGKASVPPSPILHPLPTN